ncbi:MAG: hypothetical protein COT89_00350 [Candidatus Colwellbacteria bacterium CG10_big_fil_rev_8_21_14_0_10_42_22]|uniref:Uncharacterized protein n=1 Tax=Candidatus Colwellbacteria bacterium CG10_big_fil_rev_8_21_14_0_10_42_22 TaxID=1974540 RepID=A0A2H0VGF6_9BACT|nr:MAG: hypothetical protein COT89_00350 [Candidatus Colwellbacteria bacterium CG10_big_fil_rev_8_21_14_0_10_42_22]
MEREKDGLTHPLAFNIFLDTRTLEVGVFGRQRVILSQGEEERLLCRTLTVWGAYRVADSVIRNHKRPLTGAKSWFAPRPFRVVVQAAKPLLFFWQEELSPHYVGDAYIIR